MMMMSMVIIVMMYDAIASEVQKLVLLCANNAFSSFVESISPSLGQKRSASVSLQLYKNKGVFLSFLFAVV